MDSPGGTPSNMAQTPVDLASEIFELAVEIRRSDTIGPEAGLRETVQSAFFRLDSNAEAAGFSVGEIKEFKYPLVALIDDIILNSNWSERENWRKELLQLSFFGERTA